MTATVDDVIEALAQVIDPELGVNIVDLGLVYEVDVQDGHADVAMTMTTPACPLSGVLVDDARWAVTQVSGIKQVEVELVWAPAWHPVMMSERARQQLGWQ